MSYSSFWSYCLFSFSSVSYHGLCWSLSLRTSRNWLPTSILLRGCSMELQLPLYFGLDLDSLISRDLIKWVHIIKTISFLSTDLENFLKCVSIFNFLLIFFEVDQDERKLWLCILHNFCDESTVAFQNAIFVPCSIWVKLLDYNFQHLSFWYRMETAQWNCAKASKTFYSKSYLLYFINMESYVENIAVLSSKPWVPVSDFWFGN